MNAPPWARRVFVVLGCAWPLALHAAVMTGHRAWLPAITAVLAVVALVLAAVLARRAAGKVIAVVACAAVVAVVMVAPGVLLYSPPVVIPLVAGAAFASTLLPGAEPLVSRFARLERGPLPPDLAGYTRTLTWIWAALLFAIAASALLLALFASLATWSLFTNVVSYLLLAGLFLGEYAYRRRHFPQYRHASLATLFRIVRTDGVFGSRRG
jgi:uncharacterized membrane protein